MHIGFRLRQFRPQRQDCDSAAGLVLQRINVRAPFAEPEMTDRMCVPTGRIFSASLVNFAGLARKTETVCRPPNIQLKWKPRSLDLRILDEDLEPLRASLPLS